VVFASFSPGDSLRVYRLQHRGLSLDLQRGLVRPQAPLWEAWLAYLTQQAMGAPTYVLYDPHLGEAFVQIRYRPHQSAADVSFLAPALDGGRRAAAAWSMLLDGATVDAAERGIQRLFANLPESGPEVDVFHQSGFTLYTGEEIMCLPPAPAGTRGGRALALRARRADDWPALQKLCVTLTPQRVRQAEGGISLAADESRSQQHYVLAGSTGDELLAALSIDSGGAAHWLRVLLHPAAGEIAEDLLHWALAVLSERPLRPAYCAVRAYEGGIRGALEAAGFELLYRRALLVKHTVAWVKPAVQELVPALKGGAEPVPPAFHIDREC
jgi:hypothetical protein